MVYNDSHSFLMSTYHIYNLTQYQLFRSFGYMAKMASRRHWYLEQEIFYLSDARELPVLLTIGGCFLLGPCFLKCCATAWTRSMYITITSSSDMLSINPPYCTPRSNKSLFTDKENNNEAKKIINI